MEELINLGIYFAMEVKKTFNCHVLCYKTKEEDNGSLCELYNGVCTAFPIQFMSVICWSKEVYLDFHGSQFFKTVLYCYAK